MSVARHPMMSACLALAGAASLACAGLGAPQSIGDAEQAVLTIDEARDRLDLALPGEIASQSFAKLPPMGGAATLRTTQSVPGATIISDIAVFPDTEKAAQGFARVRIADGYMRQPDVDWVVRPHLWAITPDGSPASTIFAAQSGQVVTQWRVDGIVVREPDQLRALFGDELAALPVGGSGR